MTPITPTISIFTYQESIESGQQIKSLILNYLGNNYHLQGRTTDTIYVFTEGIGIYVLTVNKTFGRIALNSYMTPEPDPINSIYLHNNREITGYLGNKWEQMKPEIIALRLINCLS